MGTEGRLRAVSIRINARSPHRGRGVGRMDDDRAAPLRVRAPGLDSPRGLLCAVGRSPRGAQLRPSRRHSMQSRPETSRRSRRHRLGQHTQAPSPRCRHARTSRTSRIASTGSTRRGAFDPPDMGTPRGGGNETGARTTLISTTTPRSSAHSEGGRRNRRPPQFRGHPERGTPAEPPTRERPNCARCDDITPDSRSSPVPHPSIGPPALRLSPRMRHGGPSACPR
jgi:hypothetical protein